jgi:hypothetical protein
VTTEDLPALENTYWLFISADDLQKIKDLNLKIVTVKSFDDFEVSMLNIQFLVAKTRSEVVKKKYLIKIVNPSS